MKIGKIVFGTVTAVLLVLAIVLIKIAPTEADFNHNLIMSDAIFDNYNSMNAGSIDYWLNSSFPSSCISTNSGFSSPDPIGYNPTQGYLYGGNVSAGTVIHHAAQAYRINPQVILATLQKESSVVSGDASYHCQYINTAMGYACPDSGACPVNPATESGFSKQVIHAAWMLRFHEQRSEGNVSWQESKPGWDNSDDPQSCYTGRMTQGSFQICPSGPSAFYDGWYTIDEAATHMDSGATAALYDYTPHFSGNQHFINIFSSWFGPTTGINSMYFAVMQDPYGSGRWYLAVNGAKHYIPSELYYVWGLDKFPVQNVSKPFFDSFPTYNDIGRLLKDEYQNYFFIDGGSAHYIRDSRYFSTWHLDPNTAVQSTGLVYALSNGGNWVGRFMTDDGGNHIYLMDGGKKHLVPSNTSLLYQWGYTNDQLTNVSSFFLNSLTDSGNITQYVSSGGRDFIIDSGRVLYFDNSDTENAYGAQTYMPMNDLFTLSMQPIEKASVFVMDQTGNWYMLEGGNKHYIPSLAVATAWGYIPGQNLTRFSAPIINSLTVSGNLIYEVQTQPSGGGSLLWAMDGTKHYMPTQTVASAWIPSGVNLPIYSSQSVDLLRAGADLTTLVQANGSPFIYTLDNGTKRYLALPSLVNAWGSPSFTSVSKLNSNLVSSVPEAPPISVTVENSGTYYLLVDGTAYPINSAYEDSWRANSSTPQIANSTLTRFKISSTQVGAFIKVGSTYYIINDLYAIPVIKHIDAFGINNSNSTTLTYNYFSLLPEASYLVKSTESTDSRIWLVNKGSKILMPSAQAINYGYLSQGVIPTALSPSVLSAIPNSSDVASLLATKTEAGVKLLSFGYALGFPDGNTLNNYVSSTNPIDDLSPSIYDQFSLKKSASILVRDDGNNVYEIRNGTKRLINNQSIIPSTYQGVPIVYLESTAIVSIPTGAPIN